MKTKTIDIQAKEWFDKTNGNSYFSARITINHGSRNQKEFTIPFRYGYGTQYLQDAKQELINRGYFNKVEDYCSLYTLCLMNDIVIRYNLIGKCKKKEVQEWGEANATV